MIEQIATGVEIANGLKSLFPTNLLHEKKINEALLQKYFAEVKFNLNILNTIDMNNFNKNSPAIKQIIANLQNDAGKELVVKIGSIGKKLNRIQKRKLNTVSEIPIVNQISFAQEKIDELKFLITLDCDKSIKQIRPKSRIKHIIDSLTIINSFFVKYYKD